MFFVSLWRSSEINSTWLNYHPPISERKTLFTCVLYTLGLLHQQKAHWHFELETLDWFRLHVPRLIDISDPNCPLFQRKPLLCLLLPSPPLSKCCPTLSTYRVARNVGGSLIFFGAAILLLFCLLSLSSSLSTLSLSLSLSSSLS